MKLKDSPTPIKGKLFLTCVLGTICLLIGLAMAFLLKDKIMFFLSITIFILSILKATELYRVISNNQYEVVEGTCVSILPKPLRKYRKIKIMDDAGIESTMLINKQTKIKIGYRYRFYFKETKHISFGNEYIDSATSTDYFLGFEELGEYENAEKTKNNNGKNYI